MSPSAAGGSRYRGSVCPVVCCIAGNTCVSCVPLQVLTLHVLCVFCVSLLYGESFQLDLKISSQLLVAFCFVQFCWNFVCFVNFLCPDTMFIRSCALKLVLRKVNPKSNWYFSI